MGGGSYTASGQSRSSFPFGSNLDAAMPNQLYVSVNIQPNLVHTSCHSLIRRVLAGFTTLSETSANYHYHFQWRLSRGSVDGKHNHKLTLWDELYNILDHLETFTWALHLAIFREVIDLCTMVNIGYVIWIELPNSA